MAFKRIFTYTILLVSITTFCACSNDKESTIDNTFYVELVNFKYDSLKQALNGGFNGKVSFYKNDKLEILSENYVTDDLPEFHYFKNTDLLDKKVKEGTKKIRVEFKNDFVLDSIKYSLQKYIFKADKWVKTSDMGDIRDFRKYEQPRYIIEEYVRVMVINIVEYSYN